MSPKKMLLVLIDFLAGVLFGKTLLACGVWNLSSGWASVVVVLGLAGGLCLRVFVVRVWKWYRACKLPAGLRIGFRLFLTKSGARVKLISHEKNPDSGLLRAIAIDAGFLDQEIQQQLRREDWYQSGD